MLMSSVHIRQKAKFLPNNLTLFSMVLFLVHLSVMPFIEHSHMYFDHQLQQQSYSQKIICKLIFFPTLITIVFFQ